MIDKDKLNQRCKATTVSGVYLKAFHCCYERLLDSNDRFKLEDYVILLDEDETAYLIHFSKPLREPMLGGGMGLCKVDKITGNVDCKLAK